MADLRYKPVPHNHAEFLAMARQRPGFHDAYDGLELKSTVVSQMVRASTNISDCAVYLTFVEILQIL